MKTFRHLLFVCFIAVSGSIYAQTEQIDSIKFFQDESIIDLTLEMEVKDLLGKKQKQRYIPATVSMDFKNGTSITEQIKVSVRGNFRRENCYMPGLSLDFHNATSPRLYKLDKLKLVCGCSSGSENEQMVLREYMAYRIYNLITDKSFRTRLVKVTFKDAAGKRKPYTQHGFFLEDVDEMAKRNRLVEVEGIQYNSELTNREQMTLVAIFEYMIGNTDWSVPNYHNIKLIGPKDGSSRPLPVPYDFDISGFVDPPYQTIDERFNIEKVTDRLYRGFPRTMEELQQAIKIFNDKKDLIYTMINNFPLFESKSKTKATSFLDEFYRTLNSPKAVQVAFIENARTN